MKKLNRKGFTLIELLAIIVILAIIMVVTIPTVLGSLGDARQSTLRTSADTVADYVEKQYTLYLMNPNDTTLDATLKKDCYAGTCKTKAVNFAATSLAAAGVKSSNYAIGTTTTVKIYTSGRACVKLTASTTGDFQSVSKKTVCSAACLAADCAEK